MVDKTLLNLRIYVHWPHSSRVAYCASKPSHRSLTTRSLTTRLVDSQKRSRSMPVHQYPLPPPKGSDPTETATSHPSLARSLRNEKPSFILRIERNSFQKGSLGRQEGIPAPYSATPTLSLSLYLVFEVIIDQFINQRAEIGDSMIRSLSTAGKVYNQAPPSVML